MTIYKRQLRSILTFLVVAWMTLQTMRISTQAGEIVGWRDLLNDPTCIQACWLGIEPQRTTGDEARSILDQLEVEYGDGPMGLPLGIPGEAALITMVQEGFHGNLFVANDLIVEVKLVINMPVAEVYQVYGYPDRVLSPEVSSGSFLALIYDDANIVVEVVVTYDPITLTAFTISATSDRRISGFYDSDDPFAIVVHPVTDCAAYGGEPCIVATATPASVGGTPITATPTTAQALVDGNYVISLNWSADGGLLAYGTGQIIPPWGYGTDGGMAQVIERNGTVVFERGFPYSVGHVSVSPTGTLVFVGPYVDVFDLATQELVLTSSDGGVGFIDGVWHPTADLLLLTEVLGSRTYDPIHRATPSILGRARMPINSPEQERTVTSVWSPDGTLAATSTTLGSVYIWDTTLEVSAVQTAFSGHTHSVQNLVWNAATNLIASGDDSGRILVWNPTTGAIVLELSGHTDAILDLDWRADGQQIVSASFDNTLRVWDYPSGEMQIVEAGRLISAVAYSPDGSELAYGGALTDPDAVTIEIVPAPAQP